MRPTAEIVAEVEAQHFPGTPLRGSRQCRALVGTGFLRFTLCLAVCSLLAVAVRAPAQDRPESLPTPIADLPSALASLERTESRSRAASLDAIDAILRPVTEDAGLEDPPPESMPESRAARNVVARHAIAIVSAKAQLVVAALEDQDPAVRRTAATVLGRLRGWGRRAAAPLVPLLQDEDHEVRRQASWALSEIVPDAELADRIAPALSSDDADVRQNVAWTLRRMGIRAAPAVPALQITLSDPREITRVNAALALGAIGRSAAPAMDALMVAAREPSAKVRANALYALRQVGESLGPALFMSAAEDEQGRRDRVPRLGQLGEDLLKDGDRDVRDQAARLLGTLGVPTDADPVAALVRALVAAAPGERGGIVWAIGKLGAPAEAVRPLASALSDPDPATRQNAAYALEQMQGKAAPALPELVRALSDTTRTVRINAAWALSWIGPPAREAVPVLLSMLDQKDPQIVGAAGAALHAIDEAAGAPVAKLAALLGSDDRGLRAAAAEALGTYGPRARDALPALVALLRRDGQRDVAEALVAIDASGTVAIPAIVDLPDEAIAKLEESLVYWVERWGDKARPHAVRLANIAAATRNQKLLEAAVGLSGAPKETVSALESAFTRSSTPLSFENHLFVRADPSGESAVPALIRLLGHADLAVRRAAAQQLVPYGPKARAAVPALIASFRNAGPGPDHDSDFEWGTRVAPVMALAAIGPEAQGAIAVVLEGMRALPKGDLCFLLLPLARLGPDDPAVVAFLAAQLGKGLRMEAAPALKYLGPKAAAAVPALIEAMAHPAGDDSDMTVIEALGAIGPQASNAREALFDRLLSDKSWMVRATRGSLGEIGCPVTPEDVRAWSALLAQDPGSPRAVVAANRLGLAGDVAKEAIPALVAAASSDVPKLREAAIWALGMFGPAAVDAVPVLVKVLQTELPHDSETSDEAEFHRRQALLSTTLWTLGSIGPAAKPALAVLAKVPGMSDEYAARRVSPPARKPLRIVVDPALAMPPSEDPYEFESRPLPRKEADGSFRADVCSGSGFGGWCVILFLSRDAQGHPVATADWLQWSDVSSGNRGPDAAEDGTLVLRSADWGSGQPILGKVWLGKEPDDGVKSGLWFQMRDPFVPPRGK